MHTLLLNIYFPFSFFFFYLLCLCSFLTLSLALWNKIFWSANIALFIILPFSHFFYEAEGIGGRGQLARLYEALAVLLLVSVVYLFVNLHIYLSSHNNANVDVRRFRLSCSWNLNRRGKCWLSSIFILYYILFWCLFSITYGFFFSFSLLL